MKPLMLVVFIAALFLITGCDEKDSVSLNQDSTNYPLFDDEHLINGRAIWLDTCKGCHGTGFAGAPVIGNRKSWEPRVAKGKAILYQHAIEGFFGPMSTYMPPRGGNDKLADNQVMAAVDYMVATLELSD